MYKATYTDICRRTHLLHVHIQSHSSLHLEIHNQLRLPEALPLIFKSKLTSGMQSPCVHTHRVCVDEVLCVRAGAKHSRNVLQELNACHTVLLPFLIITSLIAKYLRLISHSCNKMRYRYVLFYDVRKYSCFPLHFSMYIHVYFQHEG
jgi:hypothetical protein